MKLINPKTKQVIHENEFRSLFPNTALPSVINYKDYGWEVVFNTPIPEYNSITEIVQEGTPVLTSKGHYESSWVVSKKFSTKEEEDAAIAESVANSIKVLTENIINAVQDRLDNFARTKNYDGILSACTYATSTVVKFKVEGQYCVDSRDKTWAKLYEILGEAQSGDRPIPSCYEDIEKDLPVLTWPSL